MIIYVFVLLTFILSVEGQINGGLNITGIRLANGNGPYDGRVEIRVNGIWGTICDDWFDFDDAEVLCSMLNSSATWYFDNAKYGEGSGPIFATLLQCNGDESHLHQCRYDPSTTCTHSEDVSLICTRCGYIKTANIIDSSMFVNETGVTAKCKDEFDISENVYSTCNTSGFWNPPTLICKPRTPITDIRLVDGVGLYDGRVEIQMNGTWGDVCYDSFTSSSASVLCNILFDLTAYTYGRNIAYGFNDNVHITNLDCDGDETDIQECNFDLTTSCSTYYRTYVICYAYPLNITDIRLVNGTGPYDGRVELKYKDTWGTICNYWMDSYVGNTLCRMLNLSLTSYYTTAKFGQGTGPVLFGQLYCYSDSVHINDCYGSYPVFKWLCDHDSDTSIICTGCGYIKTANIIDSSISGSETGVTAKCKDEFDISENVYSTCNTSGFWNPPSLICKPRTPITDIRLVDGVGLYDGRVEIQMNGTWGDVCYYSFTRSSASVLCNILFDLTAYTYGRNIAYGFNDNVHITNLDCDGDETDIQECNFDLTTSCSTYYRTYVICNAYPLNITDIRLVNGTGPYDGRVELKYKDTWGTICNYWMDSYVGNTLCRMLNLSLTSYYTTAEFGQGTGPVLFGDVYCYSYSVHINDCRYFSPVYKWLCDHDSDTSIICTGCGLPSIPNGRITSSNGSIMTVTCNIGYEPTSFTIECLNNGTWLQSETCQVYGYPLNITEMRLADGIGLYDGRLEVKVNDTWGTVCAGSFSYSEALAICNMFNSTYIDYTTYRYYYASGSGPIYIDQLDCVGTETHINQCKYSVINTCTHSWDIAVICNGAPLNISSIRLADGTGPHNGRVELLVDDTWGTICSYGFGGENEADTLCKMMNLRLLSYSTTPVYVVSSGPTFISRLSCNGHYNNIDQCSYSTPSKDWPDLCTKNDDVSLECTDYRVNITNMRLEPGPYHGRVEIEVNGTWGTVCHNSWDTNDGEVICRMMNLTVWTVYGNSYYGEGKGPIHLDRIICSGNELDINHCSYTYTNSCTHEQDSSVICFGPYLNITDVRLGNGTGPYDGRAEIKVNGTWGTICDRNFDINDADAVCNMLGLRGAQYFTGATHGEGSGPVYIDELFCDEWDSDLNDCPYVYTKACGHDRDVSVVCNECGQPEIYYWDIGYFSYEGTTLFADCAYYKSYVGTLRITCDNVTKNWITEGECQEYKYPLSITGIRLVNGNATSNGRVEIQSMERWGTICHDYFGMNEANTICKMLGQWPAVSFYRDAHFGAGTGPIFVDNLDCGNDAIHINNCSYVTYDDCTHDDDISVVCLDCGDPTPMNGYVNSTQSNFGSVVEVDCEIGYRLEGNKTIVCELDGSWSDRPYCQYIDCESPIPEYGSANSSLTSNGTVVEISCDIGYNISGDSIVTCQSNDKWTDNPTCNILDCEALSLKNANINLPSSSTTYNSIAVITCEEGYLLNGSATVRCLEDGNWEDMPVCVIVDCGDPTPYKGIRNSTSTTYGSVVEISCEDGLQINGTSTVFCQADGTWSDNPVCDSNDCGQPAIPNGQVDTSNGTTTGSEVSIECNKGYDLNGSVVIVCQSYGWNDTTKCMKQDCGYPTVENGILTDISGTLYEDTATIECNEGHYMEGDSTITCEDGSAWSSDTVCIIQDCGPFDSPQNGYHTSDNSTTFNSTIVFSCNDNYVLVGESVMRCNSDGKWSIEVPSCLFQSEIGGQCTTNDDCKTAGAVCKNSRCECITGIYDSRTDKCDTMPLYAYGPDEGDSVHNDSERCADRIRFKLGLPLCGKSHSRIFVCTHGVISFSRRYNTPTPPNNVNKVEKIKRDILAPFHAHLSSSKGTVYYRSHDVLDSYASLKERYETKDIEAKIRKFGNAPSKFAASFILIVTWENVIPDDVDFDVNNSGGSTFQLVLASNGEMTYSFYIYGNGMMNWISKRSEFAPVWVGFSCNTETSFTYHNSFTISVLDLDKKAVHRGVSGIIFKPLVPAEQTIKNNNVSCVTWYQENKHEKRHIDLMNSWLPQCPCDISLARWDPWFWHIDRWNWHNRKNITCVDMLPGRIYRPYGKSCCYDYKTSLWIDERPIAGGLYRYHPENTIDHYNHDIVPKQMCCSPLTPYCKYYYDLRPTGTCYRESPYNFGSFWGDPHFLTLDGLSYTFNGLGEYTLLQIKTENITFDLQARTQRAVKEDGNLSDATVFSAFAAKDETNASFHVELNRARKGFNIYGNGKDITKEYNDASDEDVAMFEVPNDTLLISKRGKTLVVLFSSSGISLNVSVSVEMLSLSSIIPNAFANLTAGLLGNYNGIQDDDFTLPNGTVLSANITERKIFNYGQNWEIDEMMSAFVYPEGKNHSDYHNATYIPRFLDEVSSDKIDEANKVCNGSTNIECVFDFVFTDREEIAQSTNQLKGDTDQTRSQMDEVVPQIIGCETINATYETNVSCQITIDDDTNVEFLVNNVHASYDKDSSTILYYQAENEPVDVRVVTRNGQGRSSTVFVMEILLCTGCSGHGVCTDIPRTDHRNTESFKYATCECEPDYEGPDCEMLFDGCSEDPCSLTRDCHRLVGNNRTELNRTYICDVCPDGYLGKDTFNDTCADIDECNMDNPPCDQTCANIDGSYECSCTLGYRPDPRNKDNCLDINECEDLNNPHNCSHNCTNTDGSFNCSCYNGYTFDTESGNCLRDIVTGNDPCASKNCSQINGGCRITDNDASCFCDKGYELIIDNTCIDIDECDRNVCSQQCNNSIGSFECSCFTGYTLIGKTTCKECEFGFWGEDCMNECMCRGEGVKTCDPVKGCLCNDGWKGETCQEDVNECNETLNACNDPKKNCVNSVGSFSCPCLDGFEEKPGGTCEDIDECSIPSMHGCDQICRNNIGSFRCECKSGFVMRNSKCENINECELKTHGCEQVCDDNPGAYNCYCYFGYTLNDDRRTCTKLSDPCLQLYDLECSHYCYVSQDDSAECRCKEGFTLQSDKQTCTDIDECTDMINKHTCVDGECKNTNGSYTCECSIGFKLQNDGRTCTECDDYHYGVNCAMECSCIHGVCNKTNGCECDEGWQGNNCDADINECTTEQDKCKSDNEECINTLGSAGCQCIKGYARNELDQCIDINECSDSGLNSCDQRCINNPGSYTCECQTGFIYMDRRCRDINECDNKKFNCEQLCENTVGSYNCLCEDGFRLNLTDRESCIPSSECEDKAQCGGNSTCFRLNDEDICKCLTGFENKTSVCEDINECMTSPNLCDQNCSNTVGGYVCSCKKGYYLLNDFTTCAECKHGYFGDECNNTCDCINDNTESCNHITGACMCKPGWKGDICDEDINECSNISICPQHSTCNNTDGRYHCNCDIGYFMTHSGICSECDDKHYGESCLEKCTCDLITQQCNHINGSCECRNKGWSGDTCSDDVDECDDVDICTEMNNTVCNNTPGSYECICQNGFREIANKCEDIDECNDGNHTCDQECVNTEGNYSCQCQTGYQGDGYNCTMDACIQLVESGECAVDDCVIENDVASCKIRSDGLSFPQIIGISAGCVLGLIIIIPMIACIRCRTNRGSKYRKSLPVTTFQKDDPRNIKESNLKHPSSSSNYYLTWKTMLTQTSYNNSEDNQYEEIYKIPRVHIRRPI